MDETGIKVKGSWKYLHEPFGPKTLIGDQRASTPLQLSIGVRSGSPLAIAR